MLAEKKPQMRKAVVRLVELSQDERARMLLESQQLREGDMRIMLEDAAREGEAKGIAKGKTLGIAKGEAKGRKAQAIAIAKNLLKDNMPPDKIAIITGLSKKEIERMKSAL